MSNKNSELIIDKVPKTEKGLRMKRNIIRAGRVAFSKYGYFDTRVIDITNEAGISEGNFYRYFNNKEEVLKILIEELMRELYEASRTRDIEGSFYEKLVISTKRMMQVYKENAQLYKVLLQVLHYKEEFYELYKGMRDPFVLRIRRELDKIENFPEDLDKDYAASALGSMVSQFNYIWCVSGGEKLDKEFNPDEAAHTLAKMWFNAIKMPIEDFQDK